MEGSQAVNRPSPKLLAQWYGRLGSSNIERPNGTLRPEQPGGRMLSLCGPRAPMAADHARKLSSWEHEALAAAVWRYPVKRAAPLPHRRGRRGPRFRGNKERAVLRLLADGKGAREIARKVHVSLSTVVRLRKAVREWKDPDGEET